MLIVGLKEKVSITWQQDNKMVAPIITHLLETVAVMGIPAQIKTDNAPAYVSSKMQPFFARYNLKHVTGMPYTPTGQSIIERPNRT